MWKLPRLEPGPLVAGRAPHEESVRVDNRPTTVSVPARPTAILPAPAGSVSRLPPFSAGNAGVGRHTASTRLSRVAIRGSACSCPSSGPPIPTDHLLN